MPKIIVLSCAVIICVISLARAQVTIDVSKITCEQFVLYKIANPDMIAIWLHGYYSGKRGRTIVEPGALKENARRLRDYCLTNRDMPVMQAVEELLNP